MDDIEPKQFGATPATAAPSATTAALNENESGLSASEAAVLRYLMRFVVLHFFHSH
jgi:hypothetical protein